MSQSAPGTDDPPPAPLEADPDLLDWTTGPPKRRGRYMSVSEYRAYLQTPRSAWERLCDFLGRDK